MQPFLKMEGCIVTIFVNKIGMEHALEWKPCQDDGFVSSRMKCVVDGCSEGRYSHIGARLFCHLFQQSESIEETFTMLTNMYPTFEDMKDHLLFTILYVTEDEESFTVHSAGDGVIIKQHHDDTFSYDVIDQDNSPSYYAYNYVPKEYLRKYQDGVEMIVRVYDKSEFKNIGVASDGLMYLLESPFKEEFERYLGEGKENRIKLLLNKIHRKSFLHTLQHQQYPEPISLKDDITIAF